VRVKKQNKSFNQLDQSIRFDRTPACDGRRLLIGCVARALCMSGHVTDYYACARARTCNSAVAISNRRPAKQRDVCLVGAFDADLNGIQASFTTPASK